jgi:hypothetical protein
MTVQAGRAAAADPWTWVAATWAGPVPAPRYGHSACVLGGRIFIFGGTTKSNFLNDLFVIEIDDEQNTATVVTPKISGTPPPPRSYHTATVVKDRCIERANDAISFLSLSLWPPQFRA